MSKKPLQHKPSLRARWIIYPIVGVIFAFFLSVLLMLANGYLPEWSAGKLTFKKTGMIILAVRPLDARIFVNSVYKENTSVYLLPNKINNLLPGDYKIRIEKKGYRTWEKTLRVEPGLVTWANYVLLYTDKLDIRAVDGLSGEALATNDNGRYLFYAGSKDGKFYATSYETSGLSKHSFWPKDTSTLPDWLKSPEVLSASFSQNSDKVLLTVKNGESVQYVVSETSGNDAKLTILNDQLKSTVAGVSWSPTENDAIFANISGNLYHTRISSTALGEPLVDGVISFKLEASRLLYYARKAVSGNISIARSNLDGTGKVTILDSIAPSGGYQFAHTGDTDSLAVRSTDTGDLLLISPASGDNNVVVRLGKGYKNISWQKNGQKLLYYDENTLYRYDIERKKESHFTYGGKLKSAVWYFDDCHYLLNGENGLEIVEYDGANPLVLSFTAASTVALDAQNYNLVYSTIKDGVSEYSRFTNPH